MAPGGGDGTAIRPSTTDALPAVADNLVTHGVAADGVAAEGDGRAPDPVAGWAPARRATAGAVRAASPLAAAGIVANTANLLVTLVLARHLPPVAYGALAQLLALFFVLSMPGSALLVGVVRKITNWRQDGRTTLIDGWVTRVRRAGVVLTLSVGILGLALRDTIASVLSLPGPGGVAEMLTAGAAWCLLCVDRGLLQSALRHRALAVNLLLEGLVRSGLAVVLVLAGLGPAGAALAILLGVLVGLAHSRRVLGPCADRLRTSRLRAGCRRGGPDPGVVDQRPADPPPRARPGVVRSVPGAPVPGAPVPGAPTDRLTVEVGAALTALVLLGLLQNIDVLALGAHRSAEAGPYAAVSVACKALVFAAVALGGFLLPETAARRHHGEHALHQLGGTLAMLAVPAAVLVTVALVAPKAGLALAFGPRLSACAPALAPLAGAMTCLGATVLFTHYLLAVGERRVLAVLAAAAALVIPGVWWAQGDAVVIARVELVVHTMLAAATGLLVRVAARGTAPAEPVPGPGGPRARMRRDRRNMWRSTLARSPRHRRRDL